MKHTKQLFMILLVVFLLVGLGTLAASDVTKNDTSVTKSADVTKTNTVSKDSASKVSTTTKNDDNTKIVDTKPNSKTNENLTNKTIKKTNSKNDVKTASRTVTVTTFSQLNSYLRNGSYETVTLNINSNINLESSIVLNRAIKNLTINGNGKTINGQKQHSFLKIGESDNTNTTVTINNLNFRNCFNKTTGGVIYYWGKLKLNNCVFQDNEADRHGGAIGMSGNLDSKTPAVLEIINCKFINNTAKGNGTTPGDGGAINGIRKTKITITNTLFENNKASRYGGALDPDYTNMTITNCNFKNNYANSNGGAIRTLNGSNLTISNTNLTHNNATYGGAIHGNNNTNITITNTNLNNNTATEYGGAIYNNATLTITHSNLTHNTAKWSGAIHNWHDGNMTITNSNLSKNKATEDGGAIYYDHGKLIITQCIFTDNTANSGGAIRGSGSALTISNSTFTNNTANRYGGAIGIRMANITISNSNLNNNTAKWGGAIGGPYYNNITIINSNLNNNTATEYGGAIHHGINNVTSTGGAIHNWHDGNMTITNSNITHNTANRYGGAIYIGTYNPTQGGAINISSNNITITQTNLNNNTAAYSGGAIYNSGNLTLTVNNLNYNTANDYGGGAIHNDDGTLTITKSNLTHNNATKGGAIYTKNATCNIVNNNFEYNQLVDADIGDNNVHNTRGGAIYLDFDTITEIYGNNFTNNKATDGGAIWQDDSSGKSGFNIYDNLFENNIAIINGGAIYSRFVYYESKINNNKFISNSASNGGAVYIADDSIVTSQTIDSQYNKTKKINITDNLFENNRGERMVGALLIAGLSHKNTTITNNKFISNFGNASGNLYLWSGSFSVENNTFDNNRGNTVGSVLVLDSNVTFKNNNFINNHGVSTGGIRIANSSAIGVTWSSNTLIEHNNFINNSADLAASISIESNSFANIQYNNFINNSAKTLGGAILVSNSIVNITNSNFTHNNATNGGAIWNEGNLTITNTNLTHNNATRYGGAIYNKGYLNITNSNLQYNNATQNGGAIYNAGGKLTITQSTLNNNNAKRSGDYVGGGAIWNNQGNITITNTNLTNNNANTGGAINNNRGTLTISNSNLTNNNATLFGGALHNNEGTIKVTNSNLTNNNAEGNGGAIFNTHNLIITNTNFNHNNATISGGAISSNNGTINITNSNLTCNNAGENGGAIINYNNASLTIKNTNLTNNTAKNGGAIRNYYGRISISNTSLLNNNARESGGAIFNREGSIATLNNNIMSNNSARLNGGLIYNEATFTFADNTVTNNYVDNDFGFVVYNIGNITATGNTFVNNTDDERDMLFFSDDEDNFKASNNIYINNLLNDSIANTNVTLYNNENLRTHGIVDLRSIYNDTIRNGTLTVYINDEYYNRYTVIDGQTSDIVIADSRFNNINNTLTFEYKTLDKHYQNKTLKTNVNKFLNTTLTFDEIGEVGINDDMTINVTLRDRNGDLLPGKELLVTIGGEQFSPITDDNGVAHIPYTFHTLGNIPLTARFNGDDNYNASTTSTNAIVGLRETITQIVPVSTQHGSSSVEVTLLDKKTGQPLRNTNMYIRLPNGKTVSFTTNTTGKCIVPLDLDFGSTIVTAVFEGNNIYNASQNSTDIYIPPDYIIINGTSARVKVNQTAQIQVSVINSEGQILNNGVVEATYNGRVIGLTDLSTSKIITLEKFENSGTYTITLNFLGYGDNKASTNTTTVTVDKINTELTLDVINTMHPEDTTTITATLKDEYGNPVIGETVIIKEDAGTLTSNVTDSEGKVSITYKPLTHGEKTITAEYDAETSTVYETPNEAQKIVMVTKIPTHFHIDYDDINVGQQFDIILQLDDVDHTYLQGKPINVLIREPGKTPTNVSTTTGINGIARIPYTPSTLPITVEATFAGDNRYDLTELKEDIPGNITYITVTATDTIINQTNSIKIKVVNKSMQPVGGQIYIIIDGQSYGLRDLDNNGEFELTSYYSPIYRDEVKVVVEYYSGTYNDNTGETTFMVNKIPTQTRATIVSQNVVNNTVRVDVTADNGVTVNTGEVILYHGNTPVGSGNVQNGYANIQTRLTTPGIYNLVARYETNDYYLYSSNNTGNFELQKIPTTTQARILNNTAGNVTLNVTVTSNEAIVTDGMVEVYVNGTNTPVGTGRIENGNVIIPTTLTRGFYNFDVKYLGTDDKFLPSNDTTSLINTEVVGKPSQISGIPDNNTYGNTRVNVTLIDPETQTPIAEAPINITDNNGKTVGTGTTDRDGKATILVDVPVGYNPLTATYPGNQIYEGSSTQVDLTVDKIPTTTTAETPERNKTGQLVMPVTVTDKIDPTKTVTNGSITIYNGTTIVGTGNITNGKANINLTVTKPGIYNYSIEYSGNDIYNTSSTSLNNVEIPKIPTVINGTPKGNIVGNTSIEVKLVDIYGYNITNAPVSITLPNGTNITGTTDENGTVEIKVDLPEGYHRNIQINFTGNDDYEASNNHTNMFVYKIPTRVTGEVLNNTAGNVTLKAKVTERDTPNLVTNGSVVVQDKQGNIVSHQVALDQHGEAIIPTNIDLPGLENLTIIYLGTQDKYHENSTTLYDIEILKRPTSISGTPLNNTFKNTTIKVDLKDQKTQDPIPNAPITVLDENGKKVGEGTTDNDGKATIKLDLPVGDNPVTIKYGGEDTYEASETTLNIPVEKISSKVTGLPATGKLNNTIPVTVVVTDDMGDIINIGFVEVFNGDTYLGTVNLEEGNIIDVKFDKGGEQTLTLKYLGNTNTTGSNGTGIVTVTKIDTSLVLETPTRMHPGDIVEINATLLDENSKPLSGEIVQIVIDGKVVHTQNTDNNGKISYTYSATEIGTVNVVARYNGHTSPYYNSAQDTEKDITISKLQTTININNKVLVAHENNKINITLTDENQKTLGGKDITVTIKEPNLKATTVTGRTNSNGTLIVDYTPRSTNNIRIDAQFGGDDRYESSSNSIELDANRLATQISVTATDTIINQTNTITIKLSDKNNNPLNGRVLLDIGGQRVNVDVNNGEATYTSYSSPYSEEITVTATYPGSEGLGVSTATTQFFVDKIPTTTSTKFINQTAGNVQLEVTVNDKINNKPVNDGPITLTIGDTIIATGNIKDGKAIIPLNIPTPGDYNIIVTYLGNEYYHPSTNNTGDVEIERIPTITIAVITENIAGNVVFDVGVITEDGVARDGKVIMKANGTPIGEGEIQNGVVEISCTLPDTSGHYEFTAEYQGTSLYLPSKGNVTDIVEGRPSRIIPKQTNTTIGNTTVKVNLTDPTLGQPLAYEPIEIYDQDGNKIGEGTTNPDGTVDIKVDLPVGEHPVTVTFPGSPTNKPTSKTITLQVEKKPSQTNAEQPNSDRIGEIQVPVTVIDPATGRPITNGNITITLPNGRPVGQATITGTTTQVPITITTPGKYNLTIKYNGNDEFLPSQYKLEDIDARKINTELNVTPDTQGNITINLTDEDKNPMPNAPVVITLPNGTQIETKTTQNGTVTVPINLPPGDYPILVEYPGNETHNPSNKTTTLQIPKIPTNTTVEILNNTLSNVTIKVKVTNMTNTPVTTGTITIQDKNGQPITGLTNIRLNNGEATIKLPITTAGETIIQVQYNENEIYNESYAQNETKGKSIPIIVTKIPTTTTITVNGNTVKNINATGRVTDKFNKPVTEGTVIIRNGNTELGRATISNGQYNIPLNINTQGRYNLVAQYQGTNTYLPSNCTTATVNVNPIDTKINATIPDPTKDNTTIKVNLTDDTGKPITNAPVNITLPNGTVIPTTTDNNGTASVPVNLPVGPQTIKVTYPGNATYKPSNTTVPVTIGKIPTTTTGRVLNNTAGNVRVTGTVKDKYGRNVPEGTVSIRNGNTEIGRATVTNGVFTATTTINTGGNYPINIQYTGTNTYLPSNANLGSVTVNPRASQVTGKPEGSIAGTTNVTVTLKDPETGKPINNAPITVTLPNGTRIPATTDNNGNVKVPVDLPKGNNKVKIDYPGNSTYKPSTTTVDVPVTGKTPSIQVTPEGDKIGNSSVITVLTDPITGKPITNAPITVTLPNGSKVPATTGPDGSVKIPLDLRNTDNNITVDYLGNGTYNPVTTKINITLDKNDPIIRLNSVRGIIGEDITLTAYLTDADGKAITGGNLAFKLNGKTLRSDGRFDSNAPAMKFTVKDGFVTYTIKADLYLRNAKNLTAAYSGNYKYKEVGSPTVEAQIQKRYAGVTVTASPTWNKQYDTLTFTATVRDTTKNGKNTTLINQNTSVMFKVNGNTLRDNKGQIIYAPVGKDLKARLNYTIPAGTGGITATKKVRDYKVDAVFVGINYYPGSRNTTKFNVERSPITININEAKTTKSNILSIKATIKDYKANNVVGTNKYTIKVNGKSYTDKNGKPVYWSAKNGVINLSGIQIDPKTTIKRVMVVTGERQAYHEGRAETTKIVRA